jgi:molybdopterin-biosynthesis enzyme MoeA-like protein
MHTPHFFTLIIGTEILNRRREDAHFDFVSKSLAKHGYTLSGSFTIEDDPALIVNTIKFVASRPNAVLLSFGGIGSTPDDHTRRCAAIALRNGQIHTHPEAKRIIEAKLGKDAYPHSIRMAELPKGAELIDNPINNMPAFSLDERYFFMPGFPEMSHPMVEKILDRLISHPRERYRMSLTAACKENVFIAHMQQAPDTLEVSSLPKLSEHGWEASFSVAGEDKEKVSEYFNALVDTLKEKEIPYHLDEE